jgi:hypothetical protein
MIVQQTASVFVCELNDDPSNWALWSVLIGGGLAIVGGIIGAVITSMTAKKHQERQARDALAARIGELAGSVENWRRALYERWHTLKKEDAEAPPPPDYVFKALSEFSPAIEVCRALCPDKETRDKLAAASDASRLAQNDVFSPGETLQHQEIMARLDTVSSAIREASASALQWNGRTRT